MSVTWHPLQINHTLDGIINFYVSDQMFLKSIKILEFFSLMHYTCGLLQLTPSKSQNVQYCFQLNKV